MKKLIVVSALADLSPTDIQDYGVIAEVDKEDFVAPRVASTGSYTLDSSITIYLSEWDVTYKGSETHDEWHVLIDVPHSDITNYRVGLLLEPYRGDGFILSTVDYRSPTRTLLIYRVERVLSDTLWAHMPTLLQSYRAGAFHEYVTEGLHRSTEPSPKKATTDQAAQ